MVVVLLDIVGGVVGGHVLGTKTLPLIGIGGKCGTRHFENSDFPLSSTARP